MSSLLQRRPLFVGLGLLSCVLLAAWVYARSRPTQLGGMTMPELPGWEKRTITTTRSPQVNYRKMEQGHRLYIGLTWKFGQVTSRSGRVAVPKNILELKTEAIKGGAGKTRTMKSTGMQIKFGAPQPVQLANLQALETQGTFTTKKDVTFSQVTYFLKGSNYYILVANTTVPSPTASSVPPQFQSEMDNALREVITALTSQAR